MRRAAPADPTAILARPRTDGAMPLNLAGNRLLLLPERAALAEATGTLLVADLHLDKPEAYRREGVAIPEGILEETLARLAEVLEAHQPREVVVLGDLLHSARGADAVTADRFAAWRAAHPVPMRLVGGNHDRGVARHLDAWAIEDAGNSALLGAGGERLGLHHDPDATGEARVGGRIAGHLHPMASIASGTRHLVLPCFHLAGSVLVLPAFTAFARGVRVHPEPGDRVFAIAERRVIDVTAALG